MRSTAKGGLGVSDNYFTVTNVSTNWVQAHVRVRTGDRSVELLDFDILLSPKDVFTFDMYLGANGGIEFASCDTKTLQNSGFTTTGGCIVMNSTTNSNMLSLIKTCQGLDDAGALAATLKGYVEIMGEGRIVPLATDKNKCATWDSSNTGRTIPGRTLYQLVNDSDTTRNCAADVRSMPSSLEGRLYYVTVDAAATPFTVTRLALLNTEPTDDLLPPWGLGTRATQGIILHADTYAAEQTRCGTDPGCFAYIAATTAAAPTTGARDMNMCFYLDSTGSPATGVFNKFGAAATFGPTFADMYLRRDGTFPTMVLNLNRVVFRMSTVGAANDGGDNIGAIPPKTFVDSHYFNVPAPLIFDMQTKFAFIFPLQHFIDEKDVISAVEVYDNEENTTTITIDKFISPGLPKPGGTPGQEASIFSFNPPFVEGWVRFAPGATNSTSATACQPGATCPGTTVNTLIGSGSVSYLPAYTGVVYVTGANELGAALFTYSSSYMAAP
ncbi:MAG: hypothetical protein M0Z79_11590 [Nitrospiraceae bacterium]|nr:hypothetical protein [Nitrospiraceae bacterium]